MNYLSREGSPISLPFWQQIDDAVVKAARRVLTARRFIHLYGPLGIETQSINIDEAGAVAEEDTGGLLVTSGRRFVPLPMLYRDFTLFAKDVAASERQGRAPELAAAQAAAQALAFAEDQLVFLGDEKAGYEGILTAKGVHRLKGKDWKTGENAFADVAAAIELLVENGVYGSYALALSPDLYSALERIQPGTGILELDRVSKLVDGRIFRSPAMGKGKAVLLGADPANLDLAVGQDIATAYLEQRDLNHSFRVLETAVLRIKRKKAIVVFE